MPNFPCPIFWFELWIWVTTWLNCLCTFNSSRKRKQCCHFFLERLFYLTCDESTIVLYLNHTHVSEACFEFKCWHFFLQSQWGRWCEDFDTWELTVTSSQLTQAVVQRCSFLPPRDCLAPTPVKQWFLQYHLCAVRWRLNPKPYVCITGAAPTFVRDLVAGNLARHSG